MSYFGYFSDQETASKENNQIVSKLELPDLPHYHPLSNLGSREGA